MAKDACQGIVDRREDLQISRTAKALRADDHTAGTDTAVHAFGGHHSAGHRQVRMSITQQVVRQLQKLINNQVTQPEITINSSRDRSPHEHVAAAVWAVMPVDNRVHKQMKSRQLFARPLTGLQRSMCISM